MIFNNLVTITKIHQVTAFSCCFWRKCNFASKNSKSKLKVGIVKCTRNQKIYITGHGKASPFQPWWSFNGVTPTFDVIRTGLIFHSCLLRLGLTGTESSGWKVQNADTPCEPETHSIVRCCDDPDIFKGVTSSTPFTLPIAQAIALKLPFWTLSRISSQLQMSVIFVRSLCFTCPPLVSTLSTLFDHSTLLSGTDLCWFHVVVTDVSFTKILYSLWWMQLLL